MTTIIETPGRAPLQQRTLARRCEGSQAEATIGRADPGCIGLRIESKGETFHAAEEERTRPLAIDLFCGLGGWTESLLDLGYRVVGYDIEAHEYGEHRYPGELVLADVATLHGSQFRDAALIVASPPCQEYSYMAMPWKLAKAKAAAIRADTTGAELERLNRLFNACFRIQREACLAAGRHIPLVVENVRGAQPWVGRARWNYGSFYLWGDVPALMPATAARSALKAGITHRPDGATNFHRELNNGIKAPGMNWSDPSKRGQDFTRLAGRHAMEGIKRRDPDGYDRTHPNAFGWKAPRTSSSNVSARKAASAMIAKIPAPLAAHIGRAWWPDNGRLRGGEAQAAGTVREGPVQPGFFSSHKG